MIDVQQSPVAIAPDFEQTIKSVVQQAPVARTLAEDLNKRGLRNVYLVGSGGSHFAAWPAYTLLMNNAKYLSTHHLTSAQFSASPPKGCDGTSLVIAASHSGNTPETVEAARVARRLGAVVVGISGPGSSQLRENVDMMFDYPSEVTVTEPKVLHFVQIALSILSVSESDQDATSALEALPKFPAALLKVKEECGQLAEDVVEVIRDASLVYVLGSGGGFGAAAALAGCYLQEMQWLNAAAIDAGDFFHGPFEIVTEKTAVIVLTGEDRTRPMAERASRFVETRSSRTAVVDTRSFSLPGLSSVQRSIFSSIVLASASRRLLDFIAAARQHDTSQRRYMYKVDY